MVLRLQHPAGVLPAGHVALRAVTASTKTAALLGVRMCHKSRHLTPAQVSISTNDVYKSAVTTQAAGAKPRHAACPHGPHLPHTPPATPHLPRWPSAQMMCTRQQRRSGQQAARSRANPDQCPASTPRSWPRSTLTAGSEWGLGWGMGWGGKACLRCHERTTPAPEGAPGKLPGAVCKQNMCVCAAGPTSFACAPAACRYVLVDNADFLKELE